MWQPEHLENFQKTLDLPLFSIHVYSFSEEEIHGRIFCHREVAKAKNDNFWDKVSGETSKYLNTRYRKIIEKGHVNPTGGGKRDSKKTMSLIWH